MLTTQPYSHRHTLWETNRRSGSESDNGTLVKSRLGTHFCTHTSPMLELYQSARTMYRALLVIRDRILLYLTLFLETGHHLLRLIRMLSTQNIKLIAAR